RGAHGLVLQPAARRADGALDRVGAEDRLDGAGAVRAFDARIEGPCLARSAAGGRDGFLDRHRARAGLFADERDEPAFELGCVHYSTWSRYSLRPYPTRWPSR